MDIKTITRKSDLRPILELCEKTYHSKGLEAMVLKIYSEILVHKVKFPLLEFCSEEWFNLISEKDQLLFCDYIEDLQTEGGNVVLGKFLLLRLPLEFEGSIQKTVEYLNRADIWYISDLIGERVLGGALLLDFEKSWALFQPLLKDSSIWVIRAIGAGIHFSIKREISANHVQTMMTVLLDSQPSAHKEVKQGIGWAMKTAARFHPELMHQLVNHLKETPPNWMLSKLKTGWDYAQKS